MFLTNPLESSMINHNRETIFKINIF